MKRKPFHLTPVLRVRRLQEDGARASALRASDAHTQSSERLRIQLERYAAGGDRPSAGDASAFVRDRTMRALAAGTVASARADTEAALALVETMRAELREARTKVRTLERLEERVRAEQDAAMRRAEELEADDLVTGRFRPSDEEGS